MFLGGDLSYVNEVEDDGAVFYHRGQAQDPFVILKDNGANIVRVRLWHTPTWTQYSNLADVERTIRRAKVLNMAVMLNFHYSDTWADPAKQIIPAAWSHISETDNLAHALHDYTLDVLLKLERQGLMPDFVQVGNEINTEILMPGPYDNQPINWQRNARLINAGINAVRAAAIKTSTKPRIIIHIAQPENIVPWFDEALAAGIADFDVIGMSYYPKWSTHSLEQAAQTISRARQRYGKDMMVVEAAYPWTLGAGQLDSHLLAEDCVVPAYPATPQGQRQFLIDFTQAVCNNGGSGVVYWEPAWISTTAKPSTWENATLFDYSGAAHSGIEFLSHPYRGRE
ncbi:MAG: glycosyl hydrolase 53 family protein [Anaerolineae bacterium]